VAQLGPKRPAHGGALGREAESGAEARSRQADAEGHQSA
jgi:hypothetical protein